MPEIYFFLVGAEETLFQLFSNTSTHRICLHIYNFEGGGHVPLVCNVSFNITDVVLPIKFLLQFEYSCSENFYYNGDNNCHVDRIVIIHKIYKILNVVYTVGLGIELF